MRFFKEIVLAIFATVLVLIPSDVSAVEQSRVPQISAISAVLCDLDTGRTLYEKNPDKKIYPASTTKMMTCLLALEKSSPDSIVVANDDAADVESTRIVAGQRFYMRDIIYQMMLISDNGAAIAIADKIGGSVSGFADMMNKKAALLGMTHTHFVNPNGMPDTAHYTTARDMSILARACMQHSAFRRIVGTKQRNVYLLTPSNRKNYCENTNELLYSYPGCTGIKTGWTRAAGGCLAASASRNGRSLLVLVYHSDNEESRFDEAAALLDYGFSIDVNRK